MSSGKIMDFKSEITAPVIKAPEPEVPKLILHEEPIKAPKPQMTAHMADLIAGAIMH
jgi:hypothetical protein